MNEKIIALCVAFGSGFAACVLLGLPVIAWLKRMSIRDGEARKASETLNEINKGKASVPTMGGLFIIGAIVVAAAILLPYDSVAGWCVVGAIAASALLGAYDDWIKLTKKCDAEGKRRDGMRGRIKLMWQVAIVGGASYLILNTMPEHGGELWIPVLNESLHIGWLAIPLAVFVGVGSSNAVNLSDGLDGLAGGMMVMAAAAFAVLALLIGDIDQASALGLPYIAQAQNIGIVAAIVAGTCLGFLVYNRNPAKVFMGDTGSLALGTGLGLLAVAIRQELLLAVIGGVFVAEALSVMMQVGYFKMTGGKRIFRCSPLHHHFQFMGWHERKVTRRFWAACAICCVIGVSAAFFGARTSVEQDNTPNLQGDTSKDSSTQETPISVGR